jgi:hypothetical protein
MRSIDGLHIDRLPTLVGRFHLTGDLGGCPTENASHHALHLAVDRRDEYELDPDARAEGHGDIAALDEPVVTSWKVVHGELAQLDARTCRRPAKHH